MKMFKFFVFVSLLATTLTACEASTPSKTKLSKNNGSYTKVFHTEVGSSQPVFFLATTEVVLLANKTSVLKIDLKTLESSPVFSTAQPFRHAGLSRNASRLLTSDAGYAQVWNTSTWTLVNTFSANSAYRVSGISSTGNTLYFDKNFWVVDSNKRQTKDGIEYPSSSFAFSPNDRYFVDGGYNQQFSLSVVDLTQTKNGDILQDIPGSSASNNIRFIDNEHFVADVRGKQDIARDYRTNKLSLYNAKTRKRLASYSPKKAIQCWVTTDSHTVVSLENGTLVLLNGELSPTNNTSTDIKKVSYCVPGNNGKVWIASPESGVYAIDTHDLSIRHMIELSAPIHKLSVSPNEKHIGIVQLSAGGKSVVSIFKAGSE